MRAIGALLIIGFVMLAGATSYLLYRWPVFDAVALPFSRSGSVQPTENKSSPEEEPEEKKETKRTALKDRSKSKAAQDAVSSTPAAPENSPVEVVPLPVEEPPKQFPTEGDIQVGADRARVLATYGKPDLTTTKVQHDRLVEGYVYLQSERSTATFVHLRDGKVVSAQTTTY